MSDWLEQLDQQRTVTRPEHESSGACFAHLDHLGHICFSGIDAAHFLHNQLTNDVEHIGSHRARIAGYCSPKGRLLASLLVWNSGDALVVQIPRALQAAVQKRLQMYVLRAKVTVADASEDTVAIGVVGASAATLLQRWFSALPNAPYDKVDSDAGSLIRMADADGRTRWQWIMTQSIASEVIPVLCTQLPAVDAAHWRLTEIQAAVPQITLSTQEKFVPQMINFEVVGGVDFKKGCYPGQEIVARSQYLGKLKRRMLPASVDAASVGAGMEIFASTDLQQPCGMVVNVERDIQGLAHCLVEIKLAALEAGSIHLGVDGPVLQFSALPYALPDAD